MKKIFALFASAALAANLLANQAPMVKDLPTFYEEMLDFRERHVAWFLTHSPAEQQRMRSASWRQATNNNFEDVVKEREFDYFLALAEDSGGRARNFNGFFPWFLGDNSAALEERIIKARIAELRKDLPENDPLRAHLDKLRNRLPATTAQRIARWANLVEYSLTAEKLATLAYMRDVARQVWRTPLQAELRESGIIAQMTNFEKALRDYQKGLYQRVVRDAMPEPRPASLDPGLRKMEAQIAAYRVRAAGAEEIVYAQRTKADGTHWYESFGYWSDRYSDDLGSWNLQEHGQLVRLDLRDLQPQVLADDPEGSFRDPCVSFDGQKIVYSHRPAGSHHTHLYEMNVDGTGIRQLTDGSDDDIEPIYLPDGDLVFCSSRTRRFVPCLNAQVATLHKSDGNGDNIRMLSSNVETENTPWVMPDGRLLFMRWEYVERDRSHPHGLWTINPDGTGIMTFWGNMNEPDVFIDAKPIPGTNRVIFIRHPHGSGDHIGTVAILHPDDGPDQKSSVRNVTPDTNLDRMNGYRDPYPIADDVYLVCQLDRLYVMDNEGRRLLLASVPNGWVHEPRAIRAVEPPPIIPSRVDLSKDTGTLILADVTQSRRIGDVDYGEVDHLLLLEILPKPVHHTGHTENLSYNGNFFLERVLGNVPVEEDGSAFFEVPALRNIMMVAMNEKGESIKRMQSFVTLQPGEVSSCVGCHENRTETSPRDMNLMALRRPMSKIEKPDVPEIFHFPRDIQPILNKHCVACHDTDSRAGDVVLNDDLGPFFNQGYLTIKSRQLIASGFGGVRNFGNLPSRSVGAAHSKLYQLMRDGHQGVRLSEEELEMVYYWIESWSQYSGTFAFLNKDGDDRVPRDLGGVLKQNCASCHGDGRWNSFLSQNGAPPVDADFRENFGLRVNISDPDASLLLKAPLAVEAGGLGICRDRPAADRAEAKVSGNWHDQDQGEAANVFTSTGDPRYQKIRSSLIAFARENLAKNRMELPGATPHPDWVREMQRNGVLSEDFTPAGKDLQFYFDIDEKYYRMFWWVPRGQKVSERE